MLTTRDRESSWFLFCVLQSTFKIVKLKFEFVTLSNFANLWGFSSWSVAFKIQWNNCSNNFFLFFLKTSIMYLSKSQLSVYFSAAIAKTNITYLSNYLIWLGYFFLTVRVLKKQQLGSLHFAPFFWKKNDMQQNKR